LTWARFNVSCWKSLNNSLGTGGADGSIDSMTTRCASNQTRGFTWVELLVVIGMMALLAALLLPALAAAHKKDGRIGCVANLKEIGTAFRTGEEAEGGKLPMQVVLTNSETMKLVANGTAYLLWQTMSNELGRPKEFYTPYQATVTFNSDGTLGTPKDSAPGTPGTPKVLYCPDDKRRKAATTFSQGFSDANISYFFSLDVAESYPQMILDGDDNLMVNGMQVKPGILNLWTNSTVAWTKERHHFNGNIGLADGSVMQVTIAGLNRAIADSTNGVPTNNTPNRWVIP